MKNILVYLADGILAPKGGPVGYNYHLKKQLERMNVKNVHYIHSDGGFSKQSQSFVNKIKNKRLRYVALIIKSVVKKFTYLYGFSHRSLVDLTPYDIVHFHSPMDMYMVRDSLKKYKGTVVLTSHTPTVSHKEIIDILTEWERRHMMWYYKKLADIDYYAFMRADYIFFPCEEAEEPYYNNWDKYKEVKDAKRDRYRYLLTGTCQCTAKRSTQDIRSQYNIPMDAFVVSYVGRHNSIKGYDILKEIGEDILRKHDNVYFLIAGKEEPLQGLDNKRWIEVGWTDDPHSLIAASDVFVLPNRETYFDLVMLEVLSLGTIIVANNTGGNKYFSNTNTNGIILFNGITEAVRQVELVMQIDKDSKNRMMENNKKLFNEQFSLDVFANNYCRLINSL